ncbi:Major strawberry allergen Fra a 1.07 [Euphorbia peplus]|nr:Major strawberry allergen Fra a 1.07 [Euphorbia peplus]
MGVLTIERELTTAILRLLCPGTIKRLPLKATSLFIYNAATQLKYIKTKTEATDIENFSHSYIIIDSDPQPEKVEKATMEIKMEASANGGSIIKSCSKYYPKENCEVDEEKIKAGAENALGLFKVVEDLILANPDICN